MRKPFILIFCLGFYLAALSQTNRECAFELLFTIQPGLDKAVFLDSIHKTANAALVSSSIDKVAPYKGTGGDSITVENYVYSIQSVSCFSGKNAKFTVSFADNLLFKVYISTEFQKNEMSEMLSNYNMLRNVIKPKWQFEKSTKVSGNNLVGFGYRYTKTQKVSKKTENILLMYIDDNVSNKTNSNYTLEVVWANLANTRMQSSNY